MEASIPRIVEPFWYVPFKVNRGATMHFTDYFIHHNRNFENEVLEELHKEIHMDYSIMKHRNHFKVSTAIRLSTLYFYGPWVCELEKREKEIVYDISVSVWEGLEDHEDGNSFQIAQKRIYCVAAEEDLLWVDLDDRVFIKANTWYTIGFILNGPETLRGTADPQTEVVVPIRNYGSIRFDFLPGSRQMPAMAFWLLHPAEMIYAEEQWRENERQARERIAKRESQLRKITVWDILFEKISSFFI